MDDDPTGELEAPGVPPAEPTHDYIDVLFTGPPGPEPGQFVEVEDPDGCSLRRGEWVHREDGYWALRLRDPEAPAVAPFDSRPDTFQHIGEVRARMLTCAMELLCRAHEHDVSKLEDPELAMFDEFTPKLAGLTYGSEEYKATTAAMGPALTHHYAHNDHHPEHFAEGVAGMHLLQVIEMLCDWKAAGLRHADGGDVHRSIDLNRARFGYGPELAGFLHRTAQWLEQAEDQAAEDAVLAAAEKAADG